jgi:hypothetical protein
MDHPGRTAKSAPTRADGDREHSSVWLEHLPYKQGVSSSSLLAPTLKAPSERPVSEHVRTSGPPIGSV